MSDSETLIPGLYIVATPIGNLGELSPRAAWVLSSVDLIAAEDSRVTAKLLHHIGVKRPMIAYHDHVADNVRPQIIDRLATQTVALVSDAGTPLISDPGYKLVRDARAAGHHVTTVSGPCSAIAALTLSGLPSDRFLFNGFLPSKQGARDAALAELAAIPATLIFFESGPRLSRSLSAMATVLGDRDAAMVREISKKFEEVATGKLSELAARFEDGGPKGEIVVVVGPPVPEAPDEFALDTALGEAMARLSLKEAVAEVTARLSLPRRDVYARALELREA